MEDLASVVIEEVSKETLNTEKIDLMTEAINIEIMDLTEVVEETEISEEEAVVVLTTSIVIDITVLLEGLGKIEETGMNVPMKIDLTIVVLQEEVEEEVLAGAKALETDKMTEGSKLMMLLEIIVVETMNTKEGLMTVTWIKDNVEATSKIVSTNHQ